MRFVPAYRRQATKHFHRGIASVEFALIAIFMITLLLGLLVFWRYFQAQQSVTRAATDGARAAHSLIASGLNPCDPTHGGRNKGLIETRIKQTVTSSLQKSSMPGDVERKLGFDILEWGSCPKDGDSHLNFTITYALDSLLGNSNTWLSEPTQLQQSNSLHFATML